MKTCGLPFWAGKDEVIRESEMDTGVEIWSQICRWTHQFFNYLGKNGGIILLESLKPVRYSSPAANNTMMVLSEVSSSPSTPISSKQICLYGRHPVGLA